jgi:hypothetical protein
MPTGKTITTLLCGKKDWNLAGLADINAFCRVMIGKYEQGEPKKTLLDQIDAYIR